MGALRNDSKLLGCGVGLIASILLCFATVAVADDLEPDIAPEDDPLIASIDAFIAGLNIDKSDKDWKTKVPAPGASGSFDTDMSYYWILETNKGTLKFELFPEAAPLHVLSTIYLTRLGFYDDVKFHRIIPDFVAQGGDPTGTGNGGPGYHYDGEFGAGLSHNKAGILSMANGGPGTDGSQFFVTFGPAARLNGKHTIFGELEEGRPTLSKLERAGTTRGKPKRKVYIKKASIYID